MVGCKYQLFVGWIGSSLQRRKEEDTDQIPTLLATRIYFCIDQWFLRLFFTDILKYNYLLC